MPGPGPLPLCLDLFTSSLVFVDRCDAINMLSIKVCVRACPAGCGAVRYDAMQVRRDAMLCYCVEQYVLYVQYAGNIRSGTSKGR